MSDNHVIQKCVIHYINIWLFGNLLFNCSRLLYIGNNIMHYMIMLMYSFICIVHLNINGFKNMELCNALLRQYQQEII